MKYILKRGIHFAGPNVLKEILFIACVYFHACVSELCVFIIVLIYAL